MDESVEKIIQQVMEEADVEREELMEKIEEKQEELSGFITPEGAATIVARNNGVVPEREEPEVRKLSIEDLSVGMSNIDIVGRVERIFEPREFDRKDGSKGKVANLVLMDETGEIRAVFWDRMADLVSEDELQKGTPVQLKGAYVKKGRGGSPEVNIGRRGKIEIAPDDERVDDLPPASEAKAKIADLDSSKKYVDIVGRVTAVSAPREFERSDGSKGKVATLRIVDETGQCRVSLWGSKAEKTEKIDQGDAVRLENASVREGRQGTPELHLNWRSRIIHNPPVQETKDLPEFEKKLLKIEEIEPDMPALDLAAKVQRKFPVRDFNRDDGSSGQVMNVLLADETRTIRASFWNGMVETGKKLSTGDTILLESARSRVGLRDKPEVQVGQRTEIEVNPEGIKIEEAKPRRINMAKLEGGLDSLEIVGRVIDYSDIRDFTRSDESEGKVASLTLGDKTGTGNVTLWGSKTEILSEIDKGDVIKITDSYSVSGDYGGPEIHVGDQASIEVNPEIDEDLPPEDEIREKTSKEKRIKIEDMEEGDRVKIRGTVVRVFQRKPLFKVCPKCGRNVNEEGSEVMCEKCEEIIEPEHRVVVNMILDDGTGNIRVVAFGDLGEKLLEKSAEDIVEIFENGQDLSEFYEEVGLAGQEITLSGNVKHDDYYDQLELRARGFDFPSPKEEAERILERIKV